MRASTQRRGCATGTGSAPARAVRASSPHCAQAPAPRSGSDQPGRFGRCGPRRRGASGPAGRVPRRARRATAPSSAAPSRLPRRSRRPRASAGRRAERLPPPASRPARITANSQPPSTRRRAATSSSTAASAARRCVRRSASTASAVRSRNRAALSNSSAAPRCSTRRRIRCSGSSSSPRSRARARSTCCAYSAGVCSPATAAAQAPTASGGQCSPWRFVRGDPAGAGPKAAELGDGGGDGGGVGPRRERADGVDGGAADRMRGSRGGCPHDGQPGERLVGEGDPPAPGGELGAAVVGRGVRGEQPQLPHPRLEGMGAFHVVDPGGERHHLPQPGPGLGTGEVVAHAAAQVDGRTDVQHLVGGPAEQVHTGPSRQVCREGPLGALLRGDRRQIVPQFGEAVDALVPDALDERVQDVDGGAGIVESTVRGRGGHTEQFGQRRQSHGRGLVPAEHAAGELDRAQHREPGPRDLGAGRCGPQEPDVEARVVRDEHGPGGELEERGQNLLDPGRGTHHGGRDAGELDDVRRDRTARVDERGELAENLAATDLDRADFRDGVVRGTAAGGLEVDDDEQRLPQRRVQFVEPELHPDGGIGSAGHGHVVRVGVGSDTAGRGIRHAGRGIRHRRVGEEGGRTPESARRDEDHIVDRPGGCGRRADGVTTRVVRWDVSPRWAVSRASSPPRSPARPATTWQRAGGRRGTCRRWPPCRRPSNRPLRFRDRTAGAVRPESGISVNPRRVRRGRSTSSDAIS